MDAAAWREHVDDAADHQVLLIRAASYLFSLAAASTVSALMLRARPVCADIPFAGGIAVRTSAGPSLPIPALQNCAGQGAFLAAVLIAACVAASFAWLALNARKPPAAFCAGLYVTAAALGMGFPYVSTTDAYAYAMYGYEAGVMHVSPYRPQDLRASPDVQYRALAQLFPNPSAGVRTANYGPLFVALYAGLAQLAHGSLRAAILLERALCAAALLVAGAALGRVAFVALAPFAIFELVAFAHADAIVLALLALAWLAFARGRTALCAIAIVGAGEVKAIALLALVALAIELWRRRERLALLHAASGAAAALAISAVLSLAAFGTFSLGGAPAIAPFSSPAMLLAAAIGGSGAVIKVLAALQLAALLFFAGRFFLARRYELGAAAAIAALPAIFPWYLSWLMPIGAITKDAAFRAAVVCAAFVAILGEANLMTFTGGLGLAAATLAITYAAPPIAYRIYTSRG